jgi:hypothetical protein
MEQSNNQNNVSYEKSSEINPHQEFLEKANIELYQKFIAGVVKSEADLIRIQALTYQELVELVDSFLTSWQTTLSLNILKKQYFKNEIHGENIIKEEYSSVESLANLFSDIQDKGSFIERFVRSFKDMAIEALVKFQQIDMEALSNKDS